MKNHKQELIKLLDNKKYFNNKRGYQLNRYAIIPICLSVGYLGYRSKVLH